ncbi:hypothetical protein L1049_025590 [Liquidambar formosana]|uniref:Uncharacterized protein n=1 Tax=Liquidambar formosana TaxID=63359 RepID=A0AAP0NB68_LIQFO
MMVKLCRYGNREFYSLSDLRCGLQYSTSSATDRLGKTHFMVDYLVNSLRFSREAAVSASTKVTHLKSTHNPDLVLNFFKQSGLDKTHVRNIISLIPRLLSSNVDKTLKPKMRVLQDLGLSGSDLVEVITSNPSFFKRGLDTHIVPSIDFLKTIVRSDENVVKAIKKKTWLLSSNNTKRMQPNVVILQKCGISKEKIEKLVLRTPRRLLQNPKWLEDIVLRVENQLGIPRNSAMFSYGIDVLASMSKATLEFKYEIFKSFGWSESDIITMARNLPFCLSLSEVKIRNGLTFFMKELGYEPGYLASHPKLLMHSLEKRVLPRNAVLKVLKEKNLIRTNPSLCYIVCLPESKFMEEFVLQYKDVTPDVYEAYINVKR